MASQLSPQDRKLLNANLSARIGELPHEDGIWGSQGNKDFAYFELRDENGNLIQSENLPIARFTVDQDSKNIEFYPGNHIRGLGYESGKFTVKYIFLRKLAGDESPVLLHTKDTVDISPGDVYTALNDIYIREDGIVFAGSEEQYMENPSFAEQLAIEDLTYLIDEISNDRTEVRLKAKKIQGSYTDQFIDIQSAIYTNTLDEQIQFYSPMMQDPTLADSVNLYDLTTMQVTPNEGGFLFTKKMVNGTITIPNVYKVNEITVPVTTGINALLNPNGEEYETDSLSNILKLGDVHGWDSTLHENAVRVKNWSDGFLQFGEWPELFPESSAIGYHAHWVQNEGIAGGICMKFPDTNEPFASLDSWPNGQFYRKLAISQEMPNLQGQGVSRGDFVNIRLDVKSTVAGKGVQLSLGYANEPITENVPTNPPVGYWDPENTPPSEDQPIGAPEGFTANTVQNASSVESQPLESLYDMADQYDIPSHQIGMLAMTLEVGSTTADVHSGGLGAWVITEVQGGEGAMGSNIVYTWGPNAGNSMEGHLSPEEQWMWNGVDAWIQTENYINNPVPAVGTVYNPNAINHHPYQSEGQGQSYYARTTARGENNGWQSGTQVGLDGYVLFKDDLVWSGKHKESTTSELKLDTIETWAESNIFRQKTVIGEDGITRSLYDDIFEKGFIQTVTRAQSTSTTNVRTGHYIIFYNDGRGNDDTSNKWFQMKKGSTSFYDGSGTKSTVDFLRDRSVTINDAVNENNYKFEVTFWRHGTDNHFRYYWNVGGQVHRSIDGNGNIRNDSFSTDNYPADINSKDDFDHIPSGATVDVWFPRNAGSGTDTFTWDAVIGSSVLKQGSSDTTDERFNGAGTLGTAGVELTYGVRNPGADNFVMPGGMDWIVYDDGTAEFTFDPNPTKIGTLSPLESWEWNGSEWISTNIMPPRFNYVEPDITKALAQPTTAGQWETINVQIPVAQDWMLDQKWFLYVYGHGSVGGFGQGVVWVDNMYMDFTLRNQSTTEEVFKPYTAQILSVSDDGLYIDVNKSYAQKALELGVEDADATTVDVYDVADPEIFSSFSVSYTNFNPFELRTYLKFGEDLFLTTNFKQDKINVSNFPYGVVYKLYNPLPDGFSKFDECIVVKEMADPLVERVDIIDFIPEEEPGLVLKSPDLANVESPVQRRITKYKTESDILTSDQTISNELRNEFLSQSLDSVKINTDYSRYENFINFSSVEERIRNFKKKLENIESYKISSASYVGVSGSSKDINTYHYKIEDTKNKFDDFESYMYNKSSSYVSGSLGIFYDNAWPKSGGSGTISSPYVLAHTTSSQADTWFSNAITSASAYDLENTSKLSTLLPEFIKEDNNNDMYLRFTDMVGQHFDHIWEYINALSDVYDRRDNVDEGLSKDLIWSVAKSLGWNLNDGKDLLPLSRYALGKEVTGSAYSDYSTVSEKDISRELWNRIINNMPFFLKNKGTVRALKGLINVYGIPSTILRVKEFGGPDLSDATSPQYEITRKFTKALDFRGSQFVKTTWANDSATNRKPDTVELRFRAATGSNQILLQKEDSNNQHWYLRLKDNGSSDNYGSVSFMLSGSQVGADVGQYKEITSSALPIYDGDFYSVMVRRTSGSSNVNVSQSYELHVGKYDASRSKIHLYSNTTMDVTESPSASFSNAWTGSGDVYIGGKTTVSDVGVQFSGSIMEYRHWTEVLQTSSFKNHTRNPKAYDGNTISSSYENLTLRYSFNDDMNLSTDTGGIRDVSSNQTTTYSGSHSGFTGNFFRNVVDELKTHIPSIGALRRTSNKIRIESNPIKSGQFLNPNVRATDSAYDTAPTDSNKVGIWFAPTDVINNDIINSVANLNFDNYLGDPRDKLKLNYRGLNYTADNYWKKYTSPNNFWDYMRLIKYYDQSMYPQLRKLVPARAKPDIGLLIEPNIFERPKVVTGKTPIAENKFYSSSINIGNMVDGLVEITASYNHGSEVTNYDAYTGRIDIYSYDTGSSVVSSSGKNVFYEASGSEIKDRFLESGIWQKIDQPGEYSNVTMSAQSETISGSREVILPFISGSRIYNINQKQMNHYSSSLSASLYKAYSSSYSWSDLDNLTDHSTAFFNLYYNGVKNTIKTTSDGKPPIEIIVSAPTKLVTTDEGDSTLKTGDGIVSDFKEPLGTDIDLDEKQLMMTYEEKKMKNKGKKRGLKKLSKTAESDQKRKIKRIRSDLQKNQIDGKMSLEKTPDGNVAEFTKENEMDKSAEKIDSNDKTKKNNNKEK